MKYEVKTEIIWNAKLMSPTKNSFKELEEKISESVSKHLNEGWEVVQIITSGAITCVYKRKIS